MLLPRGCESTGSRAPAHFGMEVHVDYHEETEEEQLDEKACDGDVGAFVERGDVTASCLDPSAWMQPVSLVSCEGSRYGIRFPTYLHSVP